MELKGVVLCGRRSVRCRNEVRRQSFRQQSSSMANGRRVYAMLMGNRAERRKVRLQGLHVTSFPPASSRIRVTVPHRQEQLQAVILLQARGTSPRCRVSTGVFVRYLSISESLMLVAMAEGCAVSPSLNTLSMTDSSVLVVSRPQNALQSLTTIPAAMTSLPRFTVPA